MTWEKDLLALVAGFCIALMTSPVGVSGAVFLAPVQLTLLGVPNPQLTPTNLLYNLVSGPGALLRYLRLGKIDWPLVRSITVGSAPGVVLGAVLRVHVASDPTAFQLIAATVLLPTGLLLLRRRDRAAGPPDSSAAGSTGPSRRTISGLAFVAGVAGGMYGIGGGSLLGPVLVALGATLASVAPAALTATYLTSAVGAASFAVLAVGTSDPIGPDLSLGIAAGLGGLVGGSIGAHLQPRVPEALLRRGLAVAAIALALLYLVTAVRDLLGS